MTIEQAVYTKLNESPSLASGRIYPVVAPQGADFPYIVYEKISGVRQQHLDSVSHHARPRFRIHTYAKTYAEVKTITNSMRERLDQFRGTVSGVVIKATTIENEVDSFEEDNRIYHTALDFFISHYE